MQKIPKIFHQIWLGSELSEQFKKYQKTWIDLHPDWELKMWNESNIHALKYPIWADYEKLCNYAEKSDYLRICILLEFGGVYIDTDFECCKNIEPLLDRYEFVIGKEAPFSYANSFIGSIAGGKLLKKIYLHMPKNIQKIYLPSHRKIGPKFITRMIQKYSQNTTICYLEGYVLFREYWLHTYESGKHREQIYANHHYQLSWNQYKFGNYIFICKRKLATNYIGRYFILFLQVIFTCVQDVFWHFSSILCRFLKS